MSFLKIIFLFSFLIKLSSQQCSKMKWCLEPKFVDANNRDVDIETCKRRPCIVGTCPYGYVNKRRDCEITPVDLSSILSVYKMERDTPVPTGKFLDSDHYQIVRLKHREAHLPGFNNCTTDWINLGENEFFNGHLLEDGSFLFNGTILPAGEYVVRIVIINIAGTLQPQLKIKLAKDKEALVFLSVQYAMLLSVFFMILLLIVYVLCKELRSTAGLVLMTYVTMLAITFLLIVIRNLSVNNQVSCYVLSTVIHFFTFSSYFWMNILGFDIWWTLRNMYYGFGGKRDVDYVKYTWYCCIALLPPLLYVIAEVCLDELTTYGPRFKDCTACANKWYLTGLLLPLQAFNFIPFVLTIFNLWRIQKSTESHLHNSNSGSTGPVKQNALLSIKITVMMGPNWFMDVMLFIFEDDLPVWFVYTAEMFNALFGVAIFLVYIFKWDVLLKLFKRFKINNEITRELERRASRHHSSMKSRKWSQQSSSSSATVMQAVNSQPDNEDILKQ